MAIDPNDIQRDIANDLVKGIIARLYAVFGANYTFYTEDVPQGFKMPSFAVISMNVIRQNGMDIRKYWEFPFDIHYFTSSAAKRAEWNTVEQELALNLETISACNATIRATEIQPSTWDDEQAVGHFYIIFGVHLLDVYPELDKMEALYNSKNNDLIAGEEC